MKIKHFNNSFFELNINSKKVVLDPWIGNMDGTCTWSYPNISGNKNILNKLNPNFIYISHLHSDHYDENILKKFKKKNTKIIIKKFPDRRLKKKLNNLGYKNVIEIDPWKSYNTKDMELTLVPSDQSNSSGIKTKIFYDLDSSIIVYDKKNKICFYNNVDNPLSEKSFKKIFKITKKKYGKIDIAAVGPRSASEYPQCFLNINRNLEKKKIISKSLNRAAQILKILKVKNFIPAGGAYCISGKFYPLQKYVAHPTDTETYNFFSKKKYNVLNIDNAGELKVTKEKIQIIDQNNNSNLSKSKEKILRSKVYNFEKIKTDFNLSSIFKKAQKNYLNIIKKINLKNNYQIKIFTYKNLKLSEKGKITSKVREKFNLIPNNNIKIKYNLELHLDYRLLYLCLKNKTNWNMAMGGSSIMYIRKPNIFNPDVSSSLNFLRAN
tara:strand:- start:2533 stop:3840 length:1308 start_codon:yes stop_codon:yes gene_type:complete